MSTFVERNFKVKGVINCIFAPPDGAMITNLAGIEVQLWHKAPFESVFLGKGTTDDSGNYEIAFSLDSPSSIIVDGQIKDVFTKLFYNGELLPDANFDPDAQLYFDELSPQPSYNFKKAINDFILQLKSDSNWDKLDRLWLFATEHQAHAEVSLKNPSSTRVTEVNSPTWTADKGYSGNTSSQYINTNFNASTEGVNYQLNNSSFGVYCTTNVDEHSVEMGVKSGSTYYCTLFLRYSNDLYADINDNTGISVSNTDSKGFFTNVRSSSTDSKIYRDGSVFHSTTSNTSTGIPSASFFILARNDAGSPNYYSGKQISLAFAGSGDLSQDTFYAAVQDLATEIGFNV
jgi:hypothetical protein